MRALDQLRQTSANAREVTRNMQAASDDVQIAARKLADTAEAATVAFVAVALVAVAALLISSALLIRNGQ